MNSRKKNKTLVEKLLYNLTVSSCVCLYPLTHRTSVNVWLWLFCAVYSGVCNDGITLLRIIPGRKLAQTSVYWTTMSRISKSKGLALLGFTILGRNTHEEPWYRCHNANDNWQCHNTHGCCMRKGLWLCVDITPDSMWISAVVSSYAHWMWAYYS